MSFLMKWFQQLNTIVLGRWRFECVLIRQRQLIMYKVHLVNYNAVPVIQSDCKVQIQCCEKVFASFLISYVLRVCHTYMFQIMKQILILGLDKDSLSKCKKSLLNDDFIN